MYMLARRYLKASYLVAGSMLVALLLVSGSQFGRADDVVTRPVVSAPETANYVSERRPVRRPGEELVAQRAVQPPGGYTLSAASPFTNPWQLRATLPGAVIKDISFPTAQVGYAA